MSLLEAARPAAHRFRSSVASTVELCAKPDAAGVAATAILALALIRQGRAFHARFRGPFDQDAPTVEEEPPPLRVLLGPTAAPSQPARETLGIGPGVAPGIHGLVLDPSNAGFDPKEAPLASVAHAVALAWDDRNWDLSPYALIGTRPLAAQGWLDHVVRESRRRGHLSEATHLAAEDRPLLELIAATPGPLRGLGGSDYASAERFLQEHRLPRDASPFELAQHDVQALASALVLHHLRSGRPPAEVARLVVAQPFTTRPEAQPLPRLQGLVDAAAREGEAGLALGYLLGDTTARPELERLWTEHQRKVRTCLRAAERLPRHAGLGVVELEHRSVLECVAESLQGLDDKRPYLAICGEEAYLIHPGGSGLTRAEVQRAANANGLRMHSSAYETWFHGRPDDLRDLPRALNEATIVEARS